jgi:hypothetical protein
VRAHTGYTRAHAHVKVDGWIYKEHGREEEEDRRRRWMRRRRRKG